MTPAIVGRAAELAALDALAGQVAGGQGAVCWLQGEPGIGKSALIRALLDRAAGLGVISRPAGPVLAAGERMMELVDHWGADGPVALAVEDLHGADDRTLLAWSQLARAADHLPLLLIGSARPQSRRPAVSRLRELAAERGVVLELGPLAPEAVTELAAGIAGAVPGPRLDAVLSGAGGNPLYLTELTVGLARSPGLTVARGVAEPRPGPISRPASLTEAIGHRLAGLEPPTRAALRIAALMGTEFDAGEWSAATGHSVIEVAAMVEAAATDGVLSGSGERLRFRHEVVRQVLAAETDAADQPAVHARIARDLAAGGFGVDAVARHLRAVPGPVPDWALAWLTGLGEPVLYARPDESAELLGRAVAAAGPGHPRWEALAAGLARVLFWAGRDDQASELAAQVAGQTGDPVLAARMRILLIRSAGRTGHPARALPVTAGLVPGPGLPVVWQARLAAWSALLRRAAGDVAEAAELATAALALAGESGDPLAVATAQHAVAMCGPATGRAGHIEAALTVLPARDPESTDLRLTLLANHITVAADRGQADQAEAAVLEGRHLAERAGPARRADLLAAAAQFRYWYGRWDDALAELDGMGQESPGPDPAGSRPGLAALIALRRGDRAAADGLLGPGTGPPPGPVPFPAPAYPRTEAEAWRAETDGDLDRAVAIMSGWLAAPAGLRTAERHDSLPYLVYLALTAGREATAKVATALSEADAVTDDSPSRSAAARFCQAQLANDAAGLLAVADGYERLGWRPRQAFALEEAAVRLAADGDVTAARTALTSAVRIYTDLGAAGDIRRADRRLKQLGVRRGPNSIRRGPSRGWDALTPSERRVAELVGQGLSNPDIADQLFLSRRTVSTHVSRILGKLGVSSRLDIVRRYGPDHGHDESPDPSR